jgi:muconate cycloisomerase
MIIQTIEKFRVVVPMKPDTVNSPEFDHDQGLSTFPRVPKFILRARTEDGLAGIGETGRGVPESAVDEVIASLVGKAPRRLDLCAVAPRNAAYGAAEQVVFDLAGKAFGVPAYKLLGGGCRARVRVDYWTARRTPADLARKALEGKRLGFGGIKIKCALEDPNVERVKAVAEACGPDFKITIDPNTRFHNPIHAIRLARLLEGYNVEVFEDPVPKGNLDWYVLLRQKMNIAVALHLGSPVQVFEAVKREAVDYLNISPGNMTEFVRCAHIACAADVPVWHGSGVDLGIMDVSYVHACAAAPNCTLASDIVGNFLREDDLLVEPIRFEDGCALVPQEPGLGVELDMEAVRKYCVK